jgi:hypothetical protein
MLTIPSVSWANVYSATHSRYNPSLGPQLVLPQRRCRQSANLSSVPEQDLTINQKPGTGMD